MSIEKMSNSKMTKRALLTSIMALMLCFAMLTGTTFAWFTDQETSANNRIVAGNLDVALYHQGVKDNTLIKVDSDTDDLFDDVLPEKWEPGAVAVETFKVANEGNLALKYEFTMNVAGTTYAAINSESVAFTNLLKVAVVDGTIANGARIDTADAAYKWEKFDTFVKKGELAIDAANVGEEDFFTVIVWWEPSDLDNYFNMNDGLDEKMVADFNIKLLATQLNAESDAFNSDYDVNAEYPLVDIGFINGSMNEITLKAKEVAVSVPQGAPAGAYKLSVDSKDVTTNADNTTTVAYEIKLTKDDVAVSGGEYMVSIAVDPMLDIAKVTHNDVEITNYTYDSFTGIITFKTDSFSPFAITYTKLDVSDVEIGEDEDGNKFITGGVFVGVNPATIDETLDDQDSEYIAVNYTVGGETCYVVSKRSETVVLAASDTDYIAENANYSVTTNASGKLWSVISGLQNNEHSTVYLLPGTYNEGTTIYVYSSMDIIGLGDNDSVKVVKTSSSDSNRHLFNANGTKADYIEVTLRNMYLDATAKTTGGQDNAAVQSIRKSKVKCYDLTIVKGTDWDAVAFYVNGNNEVDGVKYPAYMYVENCELNTTRTFGIVSTNGSIKFFHSGLTYNNGTTYTSNSGSILNKTMEPNDWEWD